MNIIKPNERLSKIFALIFCCAQFVPAQGKIIASLDFDPRVNGFGFKNYRNDNRKWEDDFGVEDLILLFGARGVCKIGTNAKDCVLKPPAEQWMKKYLEAMKIGHCEGIAAAGLRMRAGKPFKKKIAAADFQPGAKSPFNLGLTPSIENYVAFFWLTQTFDEVSVPTAETAAAGPVEIANMLVSAMEENKDTFSLGMEKTEPNGEKVGHAVIPMAVEEAGGQIKIQVYDSNFPGETRSLIINKTGDQQWFYNGTNNAKGKPDYAGSKTIQSLSLTATSWREGKCFRASFTNDREKKIGCGGELASSGNPFLTNASFQKTPRFADEAVEDVEFFLTGEGEMLVTDGNGDRLGYDPRTNRYYDEIEDAVSERLIGGFEEDLPHFTFPYEKSEEPYQIVFSGKYLDEESNLDFVFSAPGFTVGFDNIRLDENEVLTATISSDGEEISFTAGSDGETPEVFYAFDSEDDSQASYFTFIEGVQLSAGKQLFYNFDFENGKLFFSDNDGNEDSYDIELIRVNPDGTRQIYTNSDLDIGKADRYEMDFENWDGKGKMCFKDDEDGDGFGDEQCSEEPDDNTDSEFDN